MPEYLITYVKDIFDYVTPLWGCVGIVLLGGLIKLLQRWF